MAFKKVFAGNVSDYRDDEWDIEYWRPQNTKNRLIQLPDYFGDSNESVFMDGSRVVVPAGWGLVMMEGEHCTGFITEEGGYVFTTNPDERQLVYAGGVLTRCLKESWDAYGRMSTPETPQKLFYFNTQELPSIKFPESEISWYDSGLDSTLKAVVTGSFTVKIMDAIRLVHNTLHDSSHEEILGTLEWENDVLSHLAHDVVSSLSDTMTRYGRDLDQNLVHGNDGGLILAQYIRQVMDEKHQWGNVWGLRVLRLVLDSMKFDDESKTLIDKKRTTIHIKPSSKQTAPQEARNGAQKVVEEESVHQTQKNEPEALKSLPDPLDDHLLADRLTRLKTLLDQNLIDETDFRDTKRRLLGL